MKKRTAILVISVLVVLTFATSAYAAMTHQKVVAQERSISANYRHAFSEFVTGVSNMDNALRKSTLVTSPAMAGAVCLEIFGRAQTAQMALGVLPFSATELEKTAGFINRVGDYAFSLVQKVAGGQQFTPEEQQSLKDLSETASLLVMNLKSMETNMGSGLQSVEHYQQTVQSFDQHEGEIIPESLGDSMQTAEKEFPEIPALLYDGPFSEHLKNNPPKMLEGMEEINQSAGRSVVAKFLGIRPEQVYPTAEMNGELKSLIYGTEIGGSPVSIALSRQGGIVYELINSRTVDRSELSPQEALEVAKKFLERRGYTNMTERYYMVSNNVLVANFAYVQDGVICYSDLIKVGVAMDNGTLHSFEAEGYIRSHVQRELPGFAVTEEAARAKVPESITVLGVEKVLIPNAGKREVLCYELECEDAGSQRYLIYVNAETGQQEKILIVLQDDNGTLTI